jgi:putative membrane protein
VELADLPAINACLNAVAAVLLVCGMAAIKRQRREVHRAFMLGAVAASILFLIGYLTYHFSHGETKYPPDAPVRGLYFATLVSHITLSGVLPFLVLPTLFFAGRTRFERHRRIARCALPVWLYVNVTGVAIFLMLRAAHAT